MRHESTGMRSSHRSARIRRLAALFAVAMLAGVAAPARGHEKDTVNFDGVHTTRHKWKGTLTESILPNQVSRGAVQPVPQHCHDDFSCCITNFYLFKPVALKGKRTGTFTVWYELGPALLRTRITLADVSSGTAKEIFAEDITTKGTESTKWTRTFSKLPTGNYQLILYNVVGNDKYAGEARWLINR